MSELNGKAAIVTGGSSGIGRATALLLARHGAAVMVSDIAEAAGKQTVEIIRRKGGRAEFIKTDVSVPGDCEALVERTLSEYGRLDIAFNNAGIPGTPALTASYGFANWRRVLDVNLTGVFNCMTYELAAMQSRGGVIVNTASIMGLQGAPGASAYSAAKHGVIGLTRTAALEYGRHGIRVNAVCPGYIATPMTTESDRNVSEKVRKAAENSGAIRRLAEPEEVSEMVFWLCSDKASFVTGAHFVVDGGVTAG